MTSDAHECVGEQTPSQALSNPTGLTFAGRVHAFGHCLSSIMLQRTVGVCAVLNSRTTLTAFPSQVAFGVSNSTLLFA